MWHVAVLKLNPETIGHEGSTMATECIYHYITGESFWFNGEVRQNQRRHTFMSLDLKKELRYFYFQRWSLWRHRNALAVFSLLSQLLYNLVDVTLTQCLGHTFKIRSWYIYIIIYGNTKVYSLTTPSSLKQHFNPKYWPT